MARKEAVKTVAVLMGGVSSNSTLSMMQDSCTTATKPTSGNDFTSDEKK
jgi:hypothetical protein